MLGINFDKIKELLQLNDVREEQLKWSMLGEISKEKKKGLKYIVDEKTRKEKLLLPIEWLKKDGKKTVEEEGKGLVDPITEEHPIEKKIVDWKQPTSTVGEGRS